MLSRSQVFLLAFPSLTLGVYYLLSGRHKARVWVLIIASLGFYGYWDLRFLPPPGRYDPARAPMVPAADVSEAERAAWTFAAHALMGDTREIGAFCFRQPRAFREPRQFGSLRRGLLTGRRA